jgi:hypothetical protein
MIYREPKVSCLVKLRSYSLMEIVVDKPGYIFQDVLILTMTARTSVHELQISNLGVISDVAVHTRPMSGRS